jgi:flagellar assembly protein FliH
MSPKIIKRAPVLEEGYSRFQGGELIDSNAAHLGGDGGEPPIDPAELLAEAQQQAEQILQDAYAEGLRLGEAAGKAEFQDAAGEAVESLRSAAEAMRLAREQYLSALDVLVVPMARAAAERILQRETRDTDLELVSATVRAAAEALMSRESFVLRMNPADLLALESQGVTALQEFAGARIAEIIPDDSIGTGGCVIDTDSLQIDARLDVQLDRVFDKLLD